MRLITLIKTPSETLVHTVDLAGRGIGEADVEVATRGLALGGMALIADALVVDGNLELRFGDGTDAEVYSIETMVNLIDGSSVTVPIELSVIDGAWSMPDGGASMLSIAEFVGRVGRDQILRLTDMGDGRIDKSLVVAALIDAQAQAEAHLVGRYRLPFETTPPIIAAIISDLARAALYQDELPDNVAEKRKIALRNLEGFRDGKLRLGADAPEDKVATSAPVRVNPGNPTYPDGLKDYSWR